MRGNVVIKDLSADKMEALGRAKSVYQAKSGVTEVRQGDNHYDYVEPAHAVSSTEDFKGFYGLGDWDVRYWVNGQTLGNTVRTDGVTVIFKPSLELTAAGDIYFTYSGDQGTAAKNVFVGFKATGSGYRLVDRRTTTGTSVQYIGKKVYSGEPTVMVWITKNAFEVYIDGEKMYRHEAAVDLGTRWYYSFYNEAVPIPADPEGWEAASMSVRFIKFYKGFAINETVELSNVFTEDEKNKLKNIGTVTIDAADDWGKLDTAENIFGMLSVTGKAFYNTAAAFVSGDFRDAFNAEYETTSRVTGMFWSGCVDGATDNINQVFMFGDYSWLIRTMTVSDGTVVYGSLSSYTAASQSYADEVVLPYFQLFNGAPGDGTTAPRDGAICVDQAKGEIYQCTQRTASNNETRYIWKKVYHFNPDIFLYGDKSFGSGQSDHKATDYVTTAQIDAVVTAANKSSRTSSDRDTINDFISIWDHQDAHGDGDQKFALAAAFFSTVLGANGLALAKGGHVEGNGCVVAGKAGHAEGTGSKVLGHYGHSGGLETEARGIYSFTHGFRVKANEDSAIALGRHDHNVRPDNDYSGANDFCSITLGNENNAMEEYSVAIGDYLDATVAHQIVIGMYNEKDNTKLFILGNGSAANSRSNALTVDFSGNVCAAGSVEAVDGIILKSPNNTKYKITVANDGTLTTTAVV